MEISKYNKRALELAGYTPRYRKRLSWRGENVIEYIKPMRKGHEFPRFHLTEMDNNWNLHADMHAFHGQFRKWMTGNNKIISQGKMINDENILLEIYHHAFKIEEHKKVIQTLKQKLCSQQ